MEDVLATKKPWSTIKKPLSIFEEVLDANILTWHNFYNNIGDVPEHVGRYEEALEYQQKAWRS